MSHMSKRERDALDRHITGNYGEDQIRDDGDAVRLTPDMTPGQACHIMLDTLISEFETSEWPIGVFVVTGNKDGQGTVHSILAEDFSTDVEKRLDIGMLIVRSLVARLLTGAFIIDASGKATDVSSKKSV